MPKIPIERFERFLEEEPSSSKQHTCRYCGEKFTQRHSLTRHLNSVHKKVKPFECYICKKRFTTKFVMQEHVRKHPLN